MSLQHHRRGGVRLGAWISGVSDADHFAGTIDEVRVYNRALTQGEIQTVMTVPVALPAPPTVLSLAAPASAAAVGQ